MRKRAFTVIEVLLVMAVMVILAGIVAYGVNSMLGSSNEGSTRLTLQNADGLYAEWRTSAGANAITPSQPLPFTLVPGDMRADFNDRNAEAIRLTRGMMFRMMQTPAVRSMVQKFPDNNLYRVVDPDLNPVQWTSTGNKIIGFECYNDVGGNRYFFVCYNSHTSAADNEPRVGVNSGNFWLQTSATTPVLLDAWRNPILFVPACGFMQSTTLLRTSAGAFPIPSGNPYWNTSGNYTEGQIVVHYGTNAVWRVYRASSNHSATANNAPGSAGSPWTEIPTTPFFMSAGQDGIMNTFEDNLFSFER